MSRGRMGGASASSAGSNPVDSGRQMQQAPGSYGGKTYRNQKRNNHANQRLPQIGDQGGSSHQQQQQQQQAAKQVREWRKTRAGR